MPLIIINATLSNPPSSLFYFRELTSFCKYNVTADVIIETEKIFKDIYFYFLRDRGLLDFVQEIVNQEEQLSGIRLDIKNRQLPITTISVDRINENNFQFLCKKIKEMI